MKQKPEFVDNPAFDAFLTLSAAGEVLDTSNRFETALRCSRETESAVCIIGKVHGEVRGVLLARVTRGITVNERRARLALSRWRKALKEEKRAAFIAEAQRVGPPPTTVLATRRLAKPPRAA